MVHWCWCSTGYVGTGLWNIQHYCEAVNHPQPHLEARLIDVAEYLSRHFIAAVDLFHRQAGCLARILPSSSGSLRAAWRKPH